MKYGLGINVDETTNEVAEKSILAEEQGLGSVWISDIPSQRYALTVASAAAAKTKKLRIGIGLLSCFLFTPKQIADGFSSLVEAYGDRFEVLIGPGDRIQLQRVGVSMSNSKGIANYVLSAKEEIKRTLLKRGLHGKIWLGAQGPRMLGIAHRFDGVLLNYASPELVKWAIDRIKKTHNKEFQIGVYAASYVYGNVDNGLSRFVRYASAMVALGAPQAAVKMLGFDEKIASWKKKLKSVDNLAPILNEISPEIVDAFSIHKPARELKSHIYNLSNLGVEQLVFGYPQGFSKITIDDLNKALF